MRYYVYHDARVLGPFDKESLASVAGLDHDTLVSKVDASSGSREGDWLSLTDVPELAGFYRKEEGIALAPAVGSSMPDFDQFHEESNALLNRIGYPDAWVSGIFEDSTLFDSHAGLAGSFGAGIAPMPDMERTAELENRLCQLQDQLELYEKQQNEILEKLGEKDKRIKDLEAKLEDSSAILDAATAAPLSPSVMAPSLVGVVAPPSASVMTPPPPAVVAPPPAAAAAPPPVVVSVPPPTAVVVPPRVVAVTPPPVMDAAPPALFEEAPPPMFDDAPPPMFDDAPPPMFDDAPPPMFEDAPPPILEEAPAFPHADVPDTALLAATSSMPAAQDFIPPSPEDAPAFDPPPMEAPPLTQPARSIETGSSQLEQVSPWDPPPLGPPLESDFPPLESASADLSAPPLLEPSGPQGDNVGTQPIDPGQFEKPKTMVFNQPPLTAPPDLAPAALPGQTMTPMPIPLGGGYTPMPGTFTPMPAMGQPDIPQTVLQGMGVGGTTTPIPGAPTPSGQSFEELMGKPATLAPNLTPSSPMLARTGLIQSPLSPVPGGATGDSAGKKKGFQSKKVLIGLALASVVLVVLLFLFFRNPKQVKQMVAMSPETSSPGDLNSEDGAGIPAPAKPTASTQSQAPNPFKKRPPEPPQQEVQAPPPEPAPTSAPPSSRAGGQDFIQDEQVQAMEFVKNYTLSGAKGDLDGWLNYSFPPPNMPQWSAGAISKNVWLVEYLVFKGPRSKAPEITYSFEVNLVKGTLNPRNKETKRLLMGSESEPKARALAPLPGEEDLADSTPQAGQGFNNPGSDGF